MSDDLGIFALKFSKPKALWKTNGFFPEVNGTTHWDQTQDDAPYHYWKKQNSESHGIQITINIYSMCQPNV